MPSTDASAAAPHNCQSCEVAVQAAMVLAESLQAGQRALHAAEQSTSGWGLLSNLTYIPTSGSSLEWAWELPFPVTRQLVNDCVEKALRKVAAEAQAQVHLNPSDNVPDMGALVSAFAGTTISGGLAMEPPVDQFTNNASDATHAASDHHLSSLGLS
ncbi:hypothetical protein H0H92_011456, partial [Tricholoma furcatifolium]